MNTSVQQCEDVQQAIGDYEQQLVALAEKNTAIRAADAEIISSLKAALDQKTLLLKIATNQLSVAKTASSALSCLTNAMNDNGPSDAIQDFVHDVVVMCTEPGTDEFVLKWKRADGAQSCSTRYTRLKRRSLLKTDASDSSRKRWVSTKARELIDLVGSVSKEHFGSILKMIGHRSGFIVVDHGELMLSVAQCVAIRDHIGTGSNGLYRLKQALEALLPVLKGLLIPPNIRNKMSIKEREGVVPLWVAEVNCTITQKGNRRGMCTYYYCEYPAQLIANMIRRMFLDGAYEESFSFSSLNDKLVVAIGIDKSDKDLVGTMRICNRKKGNSGLQVQAFACLEGPVAECYANEILTFGNAMYPTCQTLQHLEDDFYFVLIFSASVDKKRLCACSIFLPVPNPPQLTQRKLRVTYLRLAVNESLVKFDDTRTDADEGEPGKTIDRDDGLPPEVVIPLNQSDITVRLIHSKNNGSMMVGYQVLIDDVVISTLKLYHSFELCGFKPEDIQVSCKQLSGQLANDNKQINILTGQCSCTVKHPMACCMVSKVNLGVAPEWIQRRLLEDKIASVKWAFTLSPTIAY